MNKLLVVLLAALAGVPGLAQAQVPVVPPPKSLIPIAPTVPPGLYVSVLDGEIIVTNKGGSQNFTAGQSGYTSSNLEPVVVPRNPTLIFRPPPMFNSSTPQTSNPTSNKADTVDCEVR